MICLKCGEDNPEQQMYCLVCGKRLPDVSLITVMKVPTTEDTLLREVIENLNDLKEGNLSPDDFSVLMTKHFHAFEDALATVQTEAQIDDYESYSPDEMRSGYQGFELWMEGLADLSMFAETFDEEYSVSGIRKITEGNDYVNKAIYYNELVRDNEGTSGLI